MKHIPAFPFTESYDRISPDSGMNLRDFFAAAIVNGLVSNPEVILSGKNCSDHPADMAGTLATDAYAIADAMMEAREK